jgi:dienelactone hydrolase
LWSLPTVDPPTYCVVVLHMAAVSGRETAAIWQPVTNAGIAVVAVESTLRNGDGQPSWDDPKLAERDVQRGLERARAWGGSVVLAGGSQGAGVAARLALAGAAGDLAGFVCVVGAPWPGSWTARTAVPGLVVVGGADDLTAETQRRFASEAGKLGLAVDVIEIANLDHRYPDDWGTIAPELLGRWSA